MNKEKDINMRFHDRGLVRGGMLLLPPEIAMEFIRDCEAEGIQLLGFDAFRLKGNSIQPLMEHSIDLSTEPFKAMGKNKQLDAAKDFLSKRLQDDLMFEMVVG